MTETNHIASQQEEASSGAVRLSEQDERDIADRAATSVRGHEDNRRSEAVLARWEEHVHADAALHGGLVPAKISHMDREVTVRLRDEPAPRTPPSDTETELNALIAECRYLMRDVACASARLTYDPDDRIRFLGSAQSMALAAAEVGKMVAKLRGASAKTPQFEERRQRITVEHVATQARSGSIKYARGEGGTEILPESSHQ